MRYAIIFMLLCNRYHTERVSQAWKREVHRIGFFIDFRIKCLIGAKQYIVSLLLSGWTQKTWGKSEACVCDCVWMRLWDQGMQIPY